MPGVSNLSAIRAAVQMGKAAGTIQKAAKGLSTGLKTHDSSAASALYGRMSATQKVLTVGKSNAESGASMVAYARAAVGQLQDQVVEGQRLAALVGNSALSDGDRKLANTDFQSLFQKGGSFELAARSAQWGDKGLLDGNQKATDDQNLAAAKAAAAKVLAEHVEKNPAIATNAKAGYEAGLAKTTKDAFIKEITDKQADLDKEAKDKFEEIPDLKDAVAAATDAAGLAKAKTDLVAGEVAYAQALAEAAANRAIGQAAAGAKAELSLGFQTGCSLKQAVQLGLGNVDLDSLFLSSNDKLPGTSPETGFKEAGLLDISDLDGAYDAEQRLERALNQLSAVSTQLGALQKQLDEAAATAETGATSTAEAMAAIGESDIADDMQNQAKGEASATLSSAALISSMTAHMRRMNDLASSIKNT